MAQDDAAAEEENQNATMEKPIAMVAVSSVERLRSDIKYLFDVTGRPDIYETMEAGLENVGNLKGMDQTRPFGVMIFLRAGFPPAPEDGRNRPGCYTQGRRGRRSV